MRAPTLPPNARRNTLAALLAVFAVGGCADWFEHDTAGPSCTDHIAVDVTPSRTCLQLSGSAMAGAGGSTDVRITGTNGCADAVVVTSGSSDGGTATFTPGAPIAMTLVEHPIGEAPAPYSSYDAGTWSFVLPATLGSQDLTIGVRHNQTCTR